MGFVTKAQSTKFKSFQSLDTAQVATVSGPFEWVAVKSKYFVTALLAFEAGAQPIGGLAVRPHPQPGQKKADRAGIWASMLLPAEGGFRYTVYAGPMEYSRLAKVGHDFDDVNPYGWPGLPDHHPPGGGRGPLAPGLDARQPAPGVRDGAGALRHPGAASPLAAQPEGDALDAWRCRPSSPS